MDSGCIAHQAGNLRILMSPSRSARCVVPLLLEDVESQIFYNILTLWIDLLLSVAWVS